MPGLAGLSCKSNAVVLTDFCSSPVRRARLSVKVSAMRNSMRKPQILLRRGSHFLVGREGTVGPTHAQRYSIYGGCCHIPPSGRNVQSPAEGSVILKTLVWSIKRLNDKGRVLKSEPLGFNHGSGAAVE